MCIEPRLTSLRSALLLIAMSGELRAAIVEHRDVPLRHARPERDDVAVDPELGADRLTRIDGRREASFHALEARGIVTAAGLQNGVTRDPERRAAVQDRRLEAAAL